MVTPDDLTLIDAQTLVRVTDTTRLPAVQEALAYVVDHDIWQDGRAWRGPRPSGPDSAALMDEIKRGVTAPNLARSLALRHAAGVVGREPTWAVPDLAEDDSAALTAWWDRREVVTLAREAVLRALCGDVPVFRLLVPKPPERRPATLDEALELIAVEWLDSSQARVMDDAASDVRLAVAVYDAGARTLEGLLGRSVALNVAEVVAFDAAGNTTVRTTGYGDAGEPVPLPLGGRLTMHALDGVDALITQSINSLQGQLTVALSAMGRNLHTAGWVERIMQNAARPVDADGNPLPYRAGAGMTTWLQGIPDANGNPLSPGVTFREPTPPTAFVDTAEALTWHAHSEARQIHALQGTGATASGEARRQAAADFEASLMPTAKAVEAALRWLLETAYAYALYLRGSVIGDGFRASVTCNLSAGVVPVDELRELREGVGAGLLSVQRYQAAAGVEDTEAEREAMEEEEEVAAVPVMMEETADGA